LSVGIEDPRDLLADLEHAFAAVAAAIGADGGNAAAGHDTAPSEVKPAPVQNEQHFRLNPALAAFW
jgi:cystathionine gamma-synthase